jgi:hypothetical protein
MAEIVILKSGEAAPDSGDRVLVVRDATMKTCTATAWRGGELVYKSHPLSFDGALLNAQKNAAAFNIATIYLQEVKDIP